MWDKDFDFQVGQIVILCRDRRRFGAQSLVKITRVTKCYIEVAKEMYRRKDGYVKGGSVWSMDYLSLPKDEAQLEEIRDEMVKDHKARLVRKWLSDRCSERDKSKAASLELYDRLTSMGINLESDVWWEA